MMDYNSVGRLTCLSPITWQDGWPYFGLPGNLLFLSLVSHRHLRIIAF